MSQQEILDYEARLAHFRAIRTKVLQRCGVTQTLLKRWPAAVALRLLPHRKSSLTRFS